MRVVLVKKHTISRKEKQALLYFLQLQAFVAVFLSAVVTIIFGWRTGQSVLWGGLTGLIPNIFLGIFLLARADKRTPKQTVNACYLGEIFKLFFMALMITGLLKYVPVTLAPFLVGLMGNYVVYFVWQQRKPN